MPVSEAQYVIVISSRTGWSEDYIRWWLPLSRGWAYYHTARLLDGVRMRFPGGASRAGAWWEDVEARLEELRSRHKPKIKAMTIDPITKRVSKRRKNSKKPKRESMDCR